MDPLRFQSYELRSSGCESQREEGNHALRCVPFLSLKLSPSLRARAGSAHSFGQGPAPGPGFGAQPLRLPDILGITACR
jgi:hypothetical protein